jgi:hypothetical protein
MCLVAEQLGTDMTSTSLDVLSHPSNFEEQLGQHWNSIVSTPDPEPNNLI